MVTVFPEVSAGRNILPVLETSQICHLHAQCLLIVFQMLLPPLSAATHTLSSRTGSALVWHSEGRRF